VSLTRPGPRRQESPGERAPKGRPIVARGDGPLRAGTPGMSRLKLLSPKGATEERIVIEQDFQHRPTCVHRGTILPPRWGFINWVRSLSRGSACQAFTPGYYPSPPWGCTSRNALGFGYRRHARQRGGTAPTTPFAPSGSRLSTLRSRVSAAVLPASMRDAYNVIESWFAFKLRCFNGLRRESTAKHRHSRFEP